MRLPKLSIATAITMTISAKEPERSKEPREKLSAKTSATKAKIVLGTAWGRNAIKSKASRNRLRLRKTTQEKIRLIVKATTGTVTIRMAVFAKPRSNSDQ